MEKKVALTLVEIEKRLSEIDLPEVDAIIGIASGGKTPAELIAKRLKKPVYIIEINYRDKSNTPLYEKPKLTNKIEIDRNFKSILLVDDVSVSGKTLDVAKENLNGYDITTLVLKGKADLILFPEISTCVIWPWHA